MGIVVGGKERDVRGLRLENQRWRVGGRERGRIEVKGKDGISLWGGDGI